MKRAHPFSTPQWSRTSVRWTRTVFTGARRACTRGRQGDDQPPRVRTRGSAASLCTAGSFPGRRTSWGRAGWGPACAGRSPRRCFGPETEGTRTTTCLTPLKRWAAPWVVMGQVVATIKRALGQTRRTASTSGERMQLPTNVRGQVQAITAAARSRRGQSCTMVTRWRRRSEDEVEHLAWGMSSEVQGVWGENEASRGISGMEDLPEDQGDPQWDPRGLTFYRPDRMGALPLPSAPQGLPIDGCGSVNKEEQFCPAVGPP